MTVKEAIDELKYSRDMCYFDPSTGETGKPYSEECERMAQALDIAIEALEHEPVGDCISRQAVKDAINEHSEFVTSGVRNGSKVKKIYKMACNHVIDIISILPAIQPQQKTGRWKTRSEGRLHYCSECGWALMDTESGEPPYMGTDFNRSNEERWTCCPGWCGELMNFCPNCGAKMESEDQNDT